MGSILKPVKLADGRFVCQNCLKKFTAKPKSKENPGGYITEPKFCKTLCRVQFHNSGGLSFKKFEAKIQKIVDERVELKLREYDQQVARFVHDAVSGLELKLRPGAYRRRKRIT